CGPVYERVIRHIRNHQMHFDTAQYCYTQCFHDGLVRNEIRRLNVDVVPCMIYHLQVAVFNLLPYFVRSAGSDLYISVAVMIIGMEETVGIYHVVPFGMRVTLQHESELQ